MGTRRLDQPLGGAPGGMEASGPLHSELLVCCNVGEASVRKTTIGSPLVSRLSFRDVPSFDLRAVQERRVRQCVVHLTLPASAMKSMGESLYQSMDAPMAPLEKKVEAWKPAETCCFKLDLCVQLPSSPCSSAVARPVSSRCGLPALRCLVALMVDVGVLFFCAGKPARCSSWR